MATDDYGFSSLLLIHWSQTTSSHHSSCFTSHRLLGYTVTHPVTLFTYNQGFSSASRYTGYRELGSTITHLVPLFTYNQGSHHASYYTGHRELGCPITHLVPLFTYDQGFSSRPLVHWSQTTRVYHHSFCSTIHIRPRFLITPPVTLVTEN